MWSSLAGRLSADHNDVNASERSLEGLSLKWTCSRVTITISGSTLFTMKWSSVHDEAKGFLLFYLSVTLPVSLYLCYNLLMTLPSQQPLQSENILYKARDKMLSWSHDITVCTALRLFKYLSSSNIKSVHSHWAEIEQTPMGIRAVGNDKESVMHQPLKAKYSKPFWAVYPRRPYC